MRPYVVRAGDYLAKLAGRHGFDAEEVWDHAQNAELRERRSSPEVLAPGDVIHLPLDELPAPVQLSAGTTNHYRGRLVTVPVQIRVEIDGEVVADTPCTIETSPPIEAQTDGDGVVSFDAPAQADMVPVRIPSRELTLEVMLGHLDPVQEEGGMAGRLENLGYLPVGFGRQPAQVRELMLRKALDSFRRDRGIEGSGAPDEATLTALRDQHGA